MRMSTIIDRVYEALEQFGENCSMDEVVGLCPDLTWNQIFLAIDYLSKTGKVRITMDPDRTYSVQVYPSAMDPGSSRHDPLHRTVS